MPRPDPRIGTVLSARWRLERVLGAGGMATVYAATHRNGNRVAIKMLHPELLRRDDAAELRERFVKEGYVANYVDHPGAVRVLDDDVTEDGAAFLVMELLEGQAVDERWTKRGKRLDEDEVVRLADAVLDVLAAAHDKGIVHRDIKPANLFLTEAGAVKILDFGIARLPQALRAGTDPTQTGGFMGSPAFVAPEHARGLWREVDGRADVFSVGATLFTLLAGRFIHEGSTPEQHLIAAATMQAPPLLSIAPGVHPVVAAAVDRALRFDKGERWPSARAMQAAIRAAGAPASPGDPTATALMPTISLESKTLPLRPAGAATEDWSRSPSISSNEEAARPEADEARTALMARSGSSPVDDRRARRAYGAAIGAIAVAAVAVIALVLGRGERAVSSAGAVTSTGGARAPAVAASSAAEASADALPSAGASSPPLDTAARSTAQQPEPASGSPPRKRSAEPQAARSPDAPPRSPRSTGTSPDVAASGPLPTKSPKSMGTSFEPIGPPGAGR